MYNLVRDLVEAVAPTRCGGCGVVAQALCEPCMELIERIGEPQPAWLGPGRLHAAYWYEPPLRRLIQAGKYRDHRPALHVAAVLAAGRLGVVPKPGRLLVPVPLGAGRRRSRGFNQAEVIARAWSGVFGVPLGPGLRRRRDTPSQVGRHRAARAANVAGAFVWEGPDPGFEHVWLVDDVVTTGATVMSAAACLRTCGAARVDILALARA